MERLSTMRGNQNGALAIDAETHSAATEPSFSDEIGELTEKVKTVNIADLNGIIARPCLSKKNFLNGDEQDSYKHSCEAINGDVNGDNTSVAKSEDDDELNEHCASGKPTNCVDSTNSETAIARRAIEYVSYESELQMPAIMALITKDLSEPYSIYTYRYFIHSWPQLCFLALDGEKCVGAIVCKLDLHKKVVHRGYIAMLAVEKSYRNHKIGTNLVIRAIRAMVEGNCDEVVLETEITNKAALGLYENLGFVRDKRLFRYYLNGVDALRLKLWLR